MSTFWIVGSMCVWHAIQHQITVTQRGRQREGEKQSHSNVSLSFQRFIPHPASLHVFVLIYPPLSESWNSSSSVASHLSLITILPFEFTLQVIKLFCSALVHTKNDLASVTGNMSCCSANISPGHNQHITALSCLSKTTIMWLRCCPPHSITNWMFFLTLYIAGFVLCHRLGPTPICLSSEIKCLIWVKKQ